MLENGIFKGKVQNQFQGSGASFVKILIYDNQNWFGLRLLPQAILTLNK